MTLNNASEALPLLVERHADGAVKSPALCTERQRPAARLGGEAPPESTGTGMFTIAQERGQGGECGGDAAGGRRGAASTFCIGVPRVHGRAIRTQDRRSAMRARGGFPGGVGAPVPIGRRRISQRAVATSK